MQLYDDLAELYDLAFAWDLRDEAAWLLERLGSVQTLLEPACGSGRYLPVLAEHGVAVTGVDTSAAMLAIARRRAEGTASSVVEGDMRELAVEGTFDGAYCPVNTFAHLLTDEDARRHLEAVSRHLRPRGRYLVQLDLRDPSELGPSPPDAHGAWDTETRHGTLRTLVHAVGADVDRCVETVVTRFEWVAGPRAGESRERRTDMRAWSWAAWRSLVEDSPFRQVGAWDAHRIPRRPAGVDPGLEGLRLTWHVLERRAPRP